MRSLIQELLDLPEDRFVLHGSPYPLKTVLPHQARLDGGPAEYQEHAVYGTLCTEVALLYAIIHARRDWWGFRSDEQSSQLVLQAFDQSLLNPKPGYVHVLPREPFVKIVNGGLVCLAYVPVVPVAIHPVPVEILSHLQESGAVRIDR